MPKEKKTEKLFQKILKKIKPTKKEITKEQKIAEKLIHKIKKTQKGQIEVVLAGSTARNTHLKHDKDIDIFVLFPEKMQREKFENKAIEIAKKTFPKTLWEKIFTEHPYVKGKINGQIIEIVPSYKVKNASMLKSSVDRSPFHTKYLQEKLTEPQKDHIRLLRQFLKGINAYGAEPRTESFSGYVTELLVLHYGTFSETLKAVAFWKKKTSIDIEKQLTETEAKTLFNNHLIIIDPVDKNRNVAAAVSLNQMARFICAAREFAKKPSEKFFFPEKQKNKNTQRVKELIEKEGLIAIQTSYPNTTADIAWGQLKRFAKKLAIALEQKEFSVIRKEVFTDEKNYMLIIFDLKANVLEKTMKKTGPEIFDYQNSEKFLTAYKKPLSGPRIENARWAIETERKEWNAKNYLKKLLIQSKKTEKEPFKKALEKKTKILTKKEILKKYTKDKKFQTFFSQYLQGKENFL